MSRLPDKAQVQLDALLEGFRTGEVEKAIAKTMIPRHPDDVRPCDAWSLSNRVMCWLSGTADARGYRQWQAAGRHVKKGSKAVYILAPNTKTITDADKSGEEIKRQIITGFRAVPVFRLEDTDGDTLPKPTGAAQAPAASIWRPPWITLPGGRCMKSWAMSGTRSFTNILWI